MWKLKEKSCIICEKKYMPFNQLQKTCSFECSKVNKSNVDKKWRDRRFKELWYKKTTIYNKKCVQCDVDFECINKRQKTCSRRCYFEQEKTRRKWKNNPAYKTWNFVDWHLPENRKEFNYKYKAFQKNAKIIREEQRDKYWYNFCEHCKSSNAYRYETHHIIYRSEKPKHDNLHSRTNLLRLCRDCHIAFHKDKNMRYKYVVSRKLHELFNDSTLLTRHDK